MAQLICCCLHLSPVQTTLVLPAGPTPSESVSLDSALTLWINPYRLSAKIVDPYGLVSACLAHLCIQHYLLDYLLDLALPPVETRAL